MAWGVMYNGAWDYPADTRGYTWGVVQELHTKKWAFRYGIVWESFYSARVVPGFYARFDLQQRMLCRTSAGHWRPGYFSSYSVVCSPA
jgi:hypothetical protein